MINREDLIMLDELKKLATVIDTYLDKYLPGENVYPQVIHEAMRYSVFAGGKRIRPILCVKSCEMLSGDLYSAMPVACSLEMIHTYSLIHDDLPSMDNDDYRRGKPTNHRKFGDAMALLAGDALLTHAFLTLNNYALNQKKLKDKIIRAIDVIAKASDTSGMIGGQVIDISYEGMEIDENTMFYMHDNKTGALIKASVLSGAIIGGASDNDLKHLEDYSKYLGLAFQIKDDILDITGNEKLMGKRVGSDLKKKKCTFATHYGIDKSNALVEEYTEKSVASLDSFGNKADFLKRLVLFLSNRTS